MANDGKQQGAGGPLSGAFFSAAHYVRGNKLQSTALLTSILLGTTALATPFITTAAGAGAILAGSIALLTLNGKTAVRNTLALGSKFKLSALTLGLIIGSLNTVPEVMVSLGSAFRGAIELGIGNVVGSNIAHTLFILGATAAVAGIGKAKDLSWKFNALVMAGTTALFGGQLIHGTLSPVAGLAMLGLGGWYLKRHLFSAKEHIHDHDHEHLDHEHHDHKEDDGNPGTCVFHDHSGDEEDRKAMLYPRWLNFTLAGAGMAALMASADLIVRSGVSLAEKFNLSGVGVDYSLSQAAIGAVIVAIGTALPELTINIQAIKKNHSDLAVGNVLGCSIINTLIAGGVLSLSGAAVPSAFSPDTTMGVINIGAFMGSAGLLTATLMATKGALTRWQGGIALAAYTAYLASALILNESKELPVHHHGEAQQIEFVEPAPAPIKNLG